MAKYKVLKPFRDKETKEEYEQGQEVEMTVKRADEAIKNLKKWDGDFLERIDNKEVSNEQEKGTAETGRKEGHEAEAKQEGKGKKEK